MGKVIKAAKFTEFEVLIRTPEFFNMPWTQRAKVLGISRPTLYAWAKKVDWAQAEEDRQKAWRPYIAEVDWALFLKARRGNTGAAELFLARVAGWVKQSSVTVRRGPDDIQHIPSDELLAMALAVVPEENRQKVLERARTLPHEERPIVGGLPVLGQAEGPVEALGEAYGGDVEAPDTGAGGEKETGNENA